MPLFRYEVMDKSGKTMIGAMDALSELEVRQRLTSKGYTVTFAAPAAAAQPQVRPQPQPQTVPSAVRRSTSRASAPAGELAIFFRGLASFLQAGMSVHEALTRIARQTPNRRMRVISERMAARVEAGERLSESMSEFPRAFPPHVVGTVGAGELGGFLPIMVGDIALDYELARRASNRLFRALCWLGWINAIGVVAVSPLLPSLFLPGVTSVQGALVKWMSFTVPYILLPSAVLVVAYQAGAVILRQPGMRPLAHRLVLRVPKVGRAVRERSLAAFTRVLWRLQSAGVLPIQSWDTASRAAQNVVIASRLNQLVPTIRSGSTFSQALAASRLFTGEDQRVLAMGEASGQAPDILQRIAEYYEDAAVASAGAARWLGLRVVVIANLLAFGVLVYCVEVLTTMRMFDWIDWFFKVE